MSQAMTSKEAKLQRIADCNAIIAAMARHGRRFFHDKRDDTVAHLSLDGRGKARYHDHHSKQMMPIIEDKPFPYGFNGGGTLKCIIRDMANYVHTGELIPNGHFGPWHPMLNHGDLWGYGLQAMEAVRADIASNPAITPRKPAPVVEPSAPTDDAPALGM
jgi:hypothetical protein